jgi:hypothetical protein
MWPRDALLRGADGFECDGQAFPPCKRKSHRRLERDGCCALIAIARLAARSSLDGNANSRNGDDDGGANGVRQKHVMRKPELTGGVNPPQAG